MQYRKLGDSGIKVSAISIGGWINYTEGVTDPKTESNIIDAAYENGVNFFDLADGYGNGYAEKVFGEVLKQYARHTLVVSTKVWVPMSDDVNDRGLSRKHIFESIDKSLERLQMDYVDLYFCHRPDPDTPIIETARAMNDLITQGKVMYWGTSQWQETKVVEAHEICMRYGWNPPMVEQPAYNLLVRERIEQRLLPVTKERGIGLVVWSPLASGFLTGKYDDGTPNESRFNMDIDYMSNIESQWRNETSVERVKALKPIADELGVTRAQLALAWVLRDEGVSSAITGARHAKHIEENAKAAELELDDEVLAKIDAIFEGDSNSR